MKRSDLAFDAVSSSRIAKGAVATDDLAAGAVSESRLGDGAVSAAKIADGQDGERMDRTRLEQSSRPAQMQVRVFCLQP